MIANRLGVNRNLPGNGKIVMTIINNGGAGHCDQLGNPSVNHVSFDWGPAESSPSKLEKQQGSGSAAAPSNDHEC